MAEDSRTDLSVSDEQMAHLPGGIELCFQTFGEPRDPALLLIMGLGGPMTWWDTALCEQFARAGYFVIRYDNRDSGRSTKLNQRVTTPTVVRAFVGLKVAVAYTISDLADDAMALLDHLDLRAAHLVGVSMGGMIAQTAAVEHPGRVLSLASIMSSTGQRRTGWQHPKLFRSLLTDRTSSREAYVEGTVKYGPLIGSPSFPESAQAARARAEVTWDRGLDRAGTYRQMMAVLTQPDRTVGLHGITIPTLVMHGTADPLVHRSGGQATAAAVLGSQFVTVPGMGHDLPPALWDLIVSAVDTNARGLKV